MIHWRGFWIVLAGLLAGHGLLYIDATAILRCINGMHTPWLDLVMVWSTRLVQAPLIIFLFVLIGVFVNKRAFVLSLVSFAFAGLSAQALKRFVFSDRLRPHAVLDYETWHRVEGFALAENFSFPSGHSAVAFAIALSVVVSAASKAVKGIALCIALLIGFSRMYLLMHFYHDVFAGMLLGLLSA
ncbi:MAG: phosphatase PAP2 family protein, partial [Bacteroidota bacterium]|nr:phosphatase PAP2 family protein [Bacteroidota bacterium]